MDTSLKPVDFETFHQLRLAIDDLAEPSLLPPNLDRLQKGDLEKCILREKVGQVSQIFKLFSEKRVSFPCKVATLFSLCRLEKETNMQKCVELLKDVLEKDLMIGSFLGMRVICYYLTNRLNFVHEILTQSFIQPEFVRIYNRSLIASGKKREWYIANLIALSSPFYSQDLLQDICFATCDYKNYASFLETTQNEPLSKTVPQEESLSVQCKANFCRLAIENLKEFANDSTSVNEAINRSKEIAENPFADNFFQYHAFLPAGVSSFLLAVSIKTVMRVHQLSFERFLSKIPLDFLKEHLMILLFIFRTNEAHLEETLVLFGLIQSTNETKEFFTIYMKQWGILQPYSYRIFVDQLPPFLREHLSLPYIE